MTWNRPKKMLTDTEKKSGKTRGFSGVPYLLFLGVTLVFSLAVPVNAGIVYSQGSPQLSAYVYGSNEASPGDAIDLAVVVRNTGLNEIKYVQNSTTTRDDLPNTAKFLLVGLTAGDAPVVIKTDPQMIGDLKGASEVRSVFSVKVNADAPSGTYILPLQYNYTYLYTADQYDSASIRYTYWIVNGTLPVQIVIRPDVIVDVLSAKPDHLNVGTEGYIDMKIRNAGSVYGRKAVVRVLRNGNSPILPNDSSVYIGDFPPGSVVDCRYRVSVSGDAQPQSYPADVVVEYENDEGDFIPSRSETIGVPIGGKVEFAIVSDPVVMNPGNKRVVTVTYRNTGAATVYSAEARIIAVDPFTTNDDISSLGDLRPGDSATASFGLTADRTALLKEYGLDSEVRYRDGINNSYISDPVTVRIDVTQPSGISAILSNPVYLSITIILLIAAIYFAFSFRKKKRFGKIRGAG